ncbi:MAG TPA: amidase [Burkholderiales bacterium]|nr:amidase [Burkholderiales bacterium]
MKEYDRHDAMGLAKLVADRSVTPAELLEAAWARAQTINPRVNAIVARHDDQARTTVSLGVPRGPFSGVPFLLKDLHALMSGTVTSNGCRFFTDNVADHDTELVARYKRAGLVIFGKTNTPEFGLTVSTEPQLYGPTRNPWNLEYMAGGSSGGAAAAVAAGIVPVAHASDGGGSIRIPASCCGLYGFKPTRARNPHGPDRGEGWAGMSTEHVITRSVRDSAALLDVTSGPDIGAPYYAPPSVQPFLHALAEKQPPLRVGLIKRTGSGEGIDGECDTAVENTASLLERLGHRIEHSSLAQIGEGFGPAFRAVIGANTRVAIDIHAERRGKRLEVNDLEGITRLFYELGVAASAADYARATQTIHRVGRQFARLFERFDLLLTPTLPRPPQRLGVFTLNTEDPERYAREVGYFTSFTAIANIAGNPAASLPLHWTTDGLPVGVQLIGRYADEATVLRVSAQLEEAKPWFDRRPAL